MKVIGKYSLSVLLLTLTNNIFSQQTSLFNTYALDPLQLNIAYAGASCTEANLHYRAQWIGMKETPKVFQLNAHSALDKSNGLGIRVNSQSMGLLTNLGLTAGYSYRFGVSRDAKVHLGLGVGWSQASINAQKADVIDLDDVSLNNNNRQTANGFDSEFGAMYVGTKLKAGFSALHLYNTNPDFSGSSSFKVLPQINSQISYVFYKDSKLELEPWLLNRLTLKGDNVIEGIFKVNFLKSFTAGIGYRSRYGLLAVFSAKLSHLTVAYSADYGTGKNAVNLGSSHQLMIGFSLCKKPKTTLPEEEEQQGSTQPTVAPPPAEEPKQEQLAKEEPKPEPAVKEEPKQEPPAIVEDPKPEPVAKEEVKKEAAVTVEEPKPEPVVKEEPKPEAPVIKEAPEPVTEAKHEAKTEPSEPVQIPVLNEIAEKIVFAKKSSELSDENKAKLRRIAELINERKGNVTVIGYASTEGKEDFNSKLAYNRAMATKQALVKYGVKAGRLIVKNGGATESVNKEHDGNRTVRFE